MALSALVLRKPRFRGEGEIADSALVFLRFQVLLSTCLEVCGLYTFALVGPQNVL